MSTLACPFKHPKAKWWCSDTLKVRGGRVETLSKYCCKVHEFINKMINFFMNHGLISLNTAPTPPKYNPYDSKKAYFDNLKHVGKVIKQLNFCSHITPSFGPKCNMCTLPNSYKFQMVTQSTLKNGLTGEVLGWGCSILFPRSTISFGGSHMPNLSLYYTYLVHFQHSCGGLVGVYWCQFDGGVWPWHTYAMCHWYGLGPSSV